jgi:uncharacterized protein (DUF952 family)
MVDMYIIHSVLKDDYEEEIKTGFYGKSSIEKCGFIHCSDMDTYALVAPNFKDDYRERLVLVIDTDKVVASIKWEDGGGYDFPHIYGLLNIDAIEEVLPHLWSLDKEWIPDEGLKKYGFKESDFSRNS